MTIQTKTTILFTTLTTAVFLVLTVTVYYFSDQFAYNDFYKRLELRARIAAKFRFEQGHVSTESFKQIQQEYLERLPEEKSYVIALAANGKPIPPVPAALTSSYLKKVQQAGGATVYLQDHFVHYAGLLYISNGNRYLVIESAENTYGTQIIGRLKNILIITLLASIALIYSAGRYFSRNTFEPFRSLTGRVKAISEVNLHQRLPEQEGSDEIAELVRTFNTMLSRLETAFSSQQNFVSHASHELRTPLTTIIAEADYALSRERDAATYRDSLEMIMRQAEKLQQLTGGLLSFAQVSFDGKRQSWERIRIDTLLEAVQKDIDAIHPERMVRRPEDPLNAGQPPVTMGNSDLLRIAVGNVVLNGCKYSTKPVEVAVESDEGKIDIVVTDRGIGIPKGELSQVTEPFFRASNTGDIEGHGIGMPMTANIVRMHHGWLQLDSEEGEGTVVHISLPLV